MTEREIHIIEAAFSLFLRYGVKRTSMNDIAQEAGIARQTLYNAFSNKDAILRATIRLFTERAMAEVETGLRSSDTLAGKLDIVFGQLAVKPYEMLHASPNAEDIISGMNAASREEIAANNLAFQAALERVLSDANDAIAQNGLTPKALAEILQTAASAAKEKAATRAHLDELLTSLRLVALAIAEPR
ncbi:MAG: helix-turn-helix domain-containing protein [Pseudomonadota bacterium]